MLTCATLLHLAVRRCRAVGLDKASCTAGARITLTVPRLLNRLLGLKLEQQAVVFDAFTALVAKAVLTAKRRGTFDQGLEELDGAWSAVDDTTL